MDRDFQQIEWDDELEQRCRHLAELALEEDLAGGVDPTAAATIPPDAVGLAEVVAREAGVAAGMKSLAVVIDVFEADIRLESCVRDGEAFAAGTVLTRLEGKVRDILSLERTLLNFLGRLSGIASLTRRYVEAVAETGVRLYDTRKTTPGWRTLEKYAVRCGGGHNHRAGLFAAILVKDNHIAAYQRGTNPPADRSLAELVRSLRAHAHELSLAGGQPPLLIEVEVDTLDQLEDVLAGHPDLVLLDNMDLPTLGAAVAVRSRLGPDVELEASGGITLQSVAEIAASGVERISVGGLTHHAVWLDIGLDWRKEDYGAR
jgi:nicotinate-nucleotide pyrophosphorylase (carboxylating)